MRMPKCPGIPERVGVEVIDEHQFATRIADDLSRNGSDRSLNLVGSAALPVPLERPTRWGEGPAVRILFPPAESRANFAGKLETRGVYDTLAPSWRPPVPSVSPVSEYHLSRSA